SWGLLSLDSLERGRFGSVDGVNLHAFASLASGSVMAGERIIQLARYVEDERKLAEVFLRAAGGHAPR
ncbi:nitric oxide reductase transcription regulator, partial [Pseudomonas syringae pv. tagetis]